MLTRLKQIKARAFSRLSQKKPAWPPQPDDPFLAIGDLHGSPDLLWKLGDAIPQQHHDWPVIFLGDYIDRGERTEQLLKLLMSMTVDQDKSITCLMGNHEQMMLDFIDTPQEYGRHWLQNGGLQTLASFRISPPASTADNPSALDTLRDSLVKALGDEMLSWLRNLPLQWNSGNVWAVHAGADPQVAMTEQLPDVLLWGHSAFRHKPRKDGQWIVHGHSIVDTPTVKDGRIALDTGAYATGVLTAAAITSSDVTFFQTAKP